MMVGEFQCQIARAGRSLADTEGSRVTGQRPAAMISSSSTEQGSVSPAKVSGSLWLLCLGQDLNTQPFWKLFSLQLADIFWEVSAALLLPLKLVALNLMGIKSLRSNCHVFCLTQEKAG